MSSSWRITLVSRRIDNGNYIVNDRYFVAKTQSGWRWTDGNNIGVGGEWRASKREAMADLDEFVNVTSGREAFAKSRGWTE